MPPRTRTVKSTKALKENIGIATKTKGKSADKVTKPPRKVLGDKTNSASDDNASIETPNKPTEVIPSKPKPIILQISKDNIARPRRERRIPSRFVENKILKNLSNKDNVTIASNCGKENNFKVEDNIPIPNKSNNTHSSSSNSESATVSPFKTPQKVSEISLVANRPRRVSRLPSRFEDHSVSPSKFIPVQPCHASTPLAQKGPKVLDRADIEVKKSLKSSITTVEKTTLTNVVQKKTTRNKEEGRILPNHKIVNEVDKSPLKQKAVKSPVKGIKVLVKEVKSQVNTPGRTVKLPAKGVKTPVKRVKNPVKGVKSPVKVVKSPEKGVKSPVKGVKTPVKNVTSLQKSGSTKKSPVKYSYLNSVEKNTFKVQTVKSPVNPSSQAKKTSRNLRKDFSIKVLEENYKNVSNQDIYEFTFDPNDEPAPQKKKRKAAKRKPANPKPKKVIFKNNYDQNVSKALAALKNIVAKKPMQINNDNIANNQPINHTVTSKNVDKAQLPHANQITQSAVPQVQRDVASKIIIGNMKQSNSNNIKNIPHIQENILLTLNNVQTNITTKSITLPGPNQSTRVEDIAADFETSPLHEVNYSPVNTPTRPNTPDAQISKISDMHHNDPLNLRENLSFDVNPIASSSMNVSVRHPHASPWRIEFENLPIRWHVSSYVKPNMTPAVECSFVNFDDKNKKKHVYTNLVPESNEELPEMTQKDEPNLVQTSIISFIKEMVEKSANKKKRGRSATPVTASLFSDVSNNAPAVDDEKVKKTTRQLFTPKKNTAKTQSDTSNTDNSNNISDDKENSKDSTRGQKRNNNENFNTTPAKTPRKEKKEEKYFGFDDSENMENVSPQKNVGRKRSVRQARARAVLREINSHPGPTRAVLPVAVKSARTAEVERLYDEMKSASDAPAVPAKEVIAAAVQNVIEPIEELCEDTQTSVHLFEDIDVAHHLKLQPHRKSYGKAKKVTFIRQASTDTQDSDLRPVNDDSDDEGDLNDLTFDPGMPLVEEDKKRTKKKQSKRQKMSKKEEQEAEAWAAGFNSMCEDVEEFPLIVE